MKGKLLTIIAIIVLAVFVILDPLDSQPSEFTQVISSWGDQQSVASEQITSGLVKGAEGTKWVGEHQINGANWAIPNIIRRVLGVD